MAARFSDDVGMLTVWFVVDDAVILLGAIVVGVVVAFGVASPRLDPLESSENADCDTYAASDANSTDATATADHLRLFIGCPQVPGNRKRRPRPAPPLRG